DHWIKRHGPPSGPTIPPNGLPISRRERDTQTYQKANDLAREAVGCMGMLACGYGFALFWREMQLQNTLPFLLLALASARPDCQYVRMVIWHSKTTLRLDKWRTLLE
ncbi:MAG: hypothetical protein ABI901_05720, partial [Roseiflexaceae bacterium]